MQELLKQAEATDEEEDKRYGRERQGEELPEELQRRETRIARIQEAKKALKERAREKAESEGKDRKEAQPEPKAQYNFTDPESRIMKGPELVDHEFLRTSANSSYKFISCTGSNPTFMSSAVLAHC